MGEHERYRQGKEVEKYARGRSRRHPRWSRHYQKASRRKQRA